MAYLLGANISNTSPIYVGLTAIYGIGTKKALEICFELKINRKLLFKDLQENQISRLERYISQNYLTDSLLKKQKEQDIDLLIKNKSYRGKRHKMYYPVRGQRTHTNARTVKRVR
jgi:small subunit ribosomal protein S13